MSLLQMSLSGGAVILVIVLLRAAALYKLPKRFIALLWSLPLARLLVPFSIPASFSVYSLLSGKPAPAPVTDTAPAPALMPNILPGKAAAAPTPASAPSIHVVTVIWLVGMLACVLFYLSAYVRYRREFRESLPVDNDYARAWRQAHPLRRSIAIRYSDRVSAPLTYGIFRPVILVPKATDWDDHEALGYMLAHELSHIRRFDALRKLVLTAAFCIHWFNPLVWAMYVLANRDMELACDEAVIRQFGGSARAEYAMSLIRMEERKSGLLGGNLLGSHFSKNSIEERIRAIMKKTKNSLAALLAVLVLAGGATAFFATSAKAENPGGAPDSSYTAEKREDAILIRDGSTGDVSYSTDGGDTWEDLTQEAYEALTDAADVEWWTAEEYAAWLENEKEELQSIIGSRSWTPSTGWFTWTQEMVAETISGYEEILTKIQEGYLVSKTVDGSEDTLLMSGAPEQSVEGIAYEDSMESWGNDTQAYINSVDYETLFVRYKYSGLRFDEDGNLYWHDRRVRIFTDGVECDGGYFSLYEHYDPEGEVDAHVVRAREDNGDGSYNPMGPIERIEEFEPDQMFLDALEGQRYVGAEIQYWAEHTAKELERYTEFGLTFTTNARTGKLTMDWNGQPVRSLFDPERQLWVCNSLGADGLNLEAVYQNGTLTRLRISEDQEREYVETGAVIDAEATAADGSENISGETIAQRMEKYAPYGVAYEENGGKRTIRYHGWTVGSFSDAGPTGVFSVQSTEPGRVDLRTVYNANGELSGVEIVR